MENNLSQDYAPHIVGSVVSVTGNLLGRSLIDSLRKRLSPRRQEQRGDYFRDQTRGLLQTHLNIIPSDKQQDIGEHYAKVRAKKQHLENCNAGVLGLQKLRTAMEYKRLSKETYLIARKASGDAIDDDLMVQIAEAAHEPQVAPGNTFGTISTHSNPFTDSHTIAQLTNVSVNDLKAVEMTTFVREATDEAAAVLKLENKDASTQHVITTFPTSIFTGDTADKEVLQSGAPGVVAMSVHREDGTSSHLVLTPSPSSRANEDETRTNFSIVPTEVSQAGRSGQ